MCGRYRLSAKERYLRDHFGLEEDPSWTPHWNLAPTQQVPIIRQDRKEPKRTFGLVRWGLIPFWAKDRSIGFKTINAMSETAAEKPAFRDAMRQRRCLVPANAFYEWLRHEAACVIVRRHHSTGPAIPLAVPYEVWRFGDESSRSPRTMYPTVARRVSKPRGADISVSIEADRG